MVNHLQISANPTKKIAKLESISLQRVDNIIVTATFKNISAAAATARSNGREREGTPFPALKFASNSNMLPENSVLQILTITNLLVILLSKAMILRIAETNRQIQI